MQGTVEHVPSHGNGTVQVRLLTSRREMASGSPGGSDVTKGRGPGPVATEAEGGRKGLWTRRTQGLGGQGPCSEEVEAGSPRLQEEGSGAPRRLSPPELGKPRHFLTPSHFFVPSTPYLKPSFTHRFNY